MDEAALGVDLLALLTDLEYALVDLGPLVVAHLTGLGHGLTDVTGPLRGQGTDHPAVLAVLVG